MDDQELAAFLRGDAAEPTPDSESYRTDPRRGRVLAGIAVVLAVGLAAAAVGLAVAHPETASIPATGDDAGFIAQDIEQPPEDGSEAVAGSDWVDIGASDFEQYLATLYPQDIPFPSGLTQQMVVARVAEFNVGREGRAQEVGLRFAYESAAYCGWVNQWLSADRGGDSAARSEAAEMMTAAIDWPLHNELDGGGVIDLMRESAGAARSGDRTGVEYAAEVTQCELWHIEERG